MAAARQNIQDFLRDVRSQSGGIKALNYAASINADGSVQISSTPVAGGVATVIYSKVYYNQQGSAAATDKNQGADDTVVIVSFSGEPPRVGSAQDFINSLT